MRRLGREAYAHLRTPEGRRRWALNALDAIHREGRQPIGCVFPAGWMGEFGERFGGVQVTYVTRLDDTVPRIMSGEDAHHGWARFGPHMRAAPQRQGYTHDEALRVVARLLQQASATPEGWRIMNRRVEASLARSLGPRERPLARARTARVIPLARQLRRARENQIRWGLPGPRRRNRLREQIVQRIEEARYAIERQRITADYAVLPPSWFQMLLVDTTLTDRPDDGNAFFYGMRLFTTIGPRDFVVRGPPRVGASQYNQHARIDTSGLYWLGGNVAMAEEHDDRPTRLTSMPKELEAALETTMLAELKTTNPGRFARVGALAELSQQMAALYHVRVEDIGEAAMVGAEMNAVNPYARAQRAVFQPNGRALQLEAAPTHPGDIVREIVSTAMPVLRGLQLNNLLMLRSRATELNMDPVALDRQIKEAGDAMVRSDVLRGHQGDEGRREDEQDGDRRRDAGGAARDRGPVDGHALEAVARGQGHADGVAGVGRDDADRGAGEGAGREGVDGPGVGAQAVEEARVGGEVQQRTDRGGDGVDLQGEDAPAAARPERNEQGRALRRVAIVDGGHDWTDGPV